MGFFLFPSFLQLSDFLLSPNVGQCILVHVVLLTRVIDGVFLFFLVNQRIIEVLESEPVFLEKMLLKFLNQRLFGLG